MRKITFPIAIKVGVREVTAEVMPQMAIKAFICR